MYICICVYMYAPPRGPAAVSWLLVFHTRGTLTYPLSGRSSLFPGGRSFAGSRVYVSSMPELVDEILAPLTCSMQGNLAAP